MNFSKCQRWPTAQPSVISTSIIQSMMLAPVLGLSLLWLSAAPALAVEIVLKGAAPDRIERQRAEATGHLPLPGTPDLTRFRERLAERDMSVGDHIFIRIFKEESELEVWVRQSDAYAHFATYPICFWSGTLGPKLLEGDKQTPEGFYTVRRRQLHMIGRWPRSLNLGFPNRFDKSNARTGSYILVHGGCSSVGCYAMTDGVVREIYTLASAALRRGGQRVIHVHAFPFRMTDENLKRHAGSPWFEFWSDLKAGYDLFEETRIPPQVGVCQSRYVAARGTLKQGSRTGLRTLRPQARPVDTADRADDELACYRDPLPTAKVEKHDVEARARAILRQPIRR